MGVLDDFGRVGLFGYRDLRFCIEFLGVSTKIFPFLEKKIISQ